MSETVLLVEDEADLAATYERLFRRRGFAVVTAGTKDQALAFLAERHVGLVVTDIRLPDGTGLDVVRTARAAATPIVVVTGFPSVSGREQALTAGATAYVAKPFSTAALAALVDQLVAGPTESSPTADA